MNRLIHRKSAGTTLVELTATIVISSLMVIGLVVSFQSLHYHFYNEAAVLDTQEYGRLAMKIIDREIAAAHRVEDAGVYNGFARINLVTKKNGYDENKILTFTADGGLTINGKFPLEGSFKLPRHGQLSSGQERSIEVASFTISSDSPDRPDRAKLANAFWNMELIIKVTTEVLSDNTIDVKYYNYEKKVFAPNKFINDVLGPTLI